MAIFLSKLNAAAGVQAKKYQKTWPYFDISEIRVGPFLPSLDQPFRQMIHGKSTAEDGVGIAGFYVSLLGMGGNPIQVLLDLRCDLRRAGKHVDIQHIVLKVLFDKGVLITQNDGTSSGQLKDAGRGRS